MIILFQIWSVTLIMQDKQTPQCVIAFCFFTCLLVVIVYVIILKNIRGED
jgi:hypothetical protein